MVCASSPLLIVFKRTGGRAWLKPWGFKGHTQTQKSTRRHQQKRLASNADALREAETAHWAHLEATGTLPHWGESVEQVRQRKLSADRKWTLWQAASKRYLPQLQSLHDSILQETRRS